MKLTRVIFLFIAIHFFAWSELRAQEPVADFHVRLSTLNSNDGLSQGFISCMVQDKRGYVWVATKDGLNRYDGYVFTVYRHDIDNPNSISDNFVFNIFEDTRGLLWISTLRGLDVFDPVRETFSHIDVVPEGIKLRGDAKRVTEDAFGNLWYQVGGRYVCLSIHKTNEGGKPVTPEFSYRVKLADEKFKFIPKQTEELFFDPDGGMWVASGNELIYVSKNDQLANKLTAKYDQATFCQLPGCKIVKIVSRGPRRVIHFITTTGIAIYDLATMRIEQSTVKEMAPIGNEHAIAIDGSGNTWVYSDEGLMLFETKSRVFRKVSPLNQDQSWSTHVIRSMLIDRGGIVWLGTNGFSIYKYNPQVARFHFIESNSVTSISGDNQGRIFVGLNTGKSIFIPSKSEFAGKAFQDDKFRLLIGDEFCYPASIIQDNDGIYWFGYGHGYLGRYDEQKDELKIFGGNGPFAGASSTTWLDTKGDPWVVLDSNAVFYLRHFDKASQQFSPLIPFAEKQTDFAYPLISSVHVAADNEFWFGTTQGLYAYSTSKKQWKMYKNIPGDKRSLSGNTIFSLCGDPADKNSLWIGTNGAGLNKLDKTTGKFTRFTEQDGLPNDVVYGILSDGQQNLWLSTNRGLCRFNIATQQCKNFYESNGLQGNEFNRYAYYKAKDGALFFGGLDGFNFFYPADMNESGPPPQIVFTGLKLFNEPVSFRDSAALILKPIDFIEELKLDYDQNVVTIGFAAMDFSASDKNQFKYKLEGFDKDWTFAGSRREAIYTGLTPGEYVFIVKAVNSEGVWNEEGRSIRIVVLPPWWKTWWARTMFAIIGLGLLVFFIWLRTSSLRRTQTMLEHKVSERTQELHETITNLKQTQAQLVQNEKLASFGQLTAGIAHEIKNPLNFINNFSELGNELIGELKEAKTEEEREEIIGMLKSNLEKINFHGLRVDSIIKSMLDHSRTAGSQKLLTDLNKLCDDYSNLAYHSIRANVQDFSCSLKKQFDYDLPSMNLNSQDISRVLLNMLNNAFYAVNEKRKTAGPDYNPEVVISTSRVKNTAMLVVYDNGCGISDEMKNKVFKPFFTSKRPGEGTGLGLSISYDIIQSHGGQMQMESTLNEFTRFTIRIPITDPDKIPLT
jgi:signal transduction histidine kinase/ligand-binding sensor domain-containing protein